MITVGLEFVIVLVCVQFFSKLFYRFLQAPNKYQELRNLGWAFLFLGFGGLWIAFITADYFTSDMILRDTICLWGYFSLILGATVFVTFTEHIEHSKIKIFTTLLLVFLIITITGLILDSRILTLTFLYCSAPVAVGYIVHYIRFLKKVTNNAKETQSAIWSCLLGLSIILWGFFLTWDLILNSFGIQIRIAGDVMILIGTLIFWFSLDAIPNPAEFEWKQSIKGIMLISSKSGLSYFSRFYRIDKMDASQEFFISGALSSIDTILKAMMDDKRLKTVNLSDKTLHFEYRKSFIGVVFADQSMRILQFRLRQFADAFEQRFGDKLDQWNGDSSLFEPMERVTDKIFMPKSE